MKNNLQRILTWIFFCVGVILIGKAILLPSFPDFTAYYEAASRFLHHADIYQSGIGMPFIYPPSALILIIPFAFLPIHIAGTVWAILSLIAFFTAITLLLKIEGEKTFSNRFLVIFAIACFSFPARFTLGMGQINMFLLSFLVLFLYSLDRGKQTRSGSFLGTAIAIKLFPILFLPFLLLIKKWRDFTSSVVAIGILAIASIFLFGIYDFLFFFTRVFPILTATNRTDYYNQALSGFLFRTFSHTPMSNVLFFSLSITMLFGSLYAIWIKRKETTLYPLSFGLLIATQLLLNSFSWQHHFVWLLIPYVQLLYTLIKGKYSSKYYVLLGLSYLFTQSNIKYPQHTPVFFQSHVFYGTLILWGYILYVLTKHHDHTISH